MRLAAAQPPRDPKSVCRASPEWRTLALSALIYGCWAVLTFWHASLSTPLLALLGGWLIAWHGSLQHETIHGHPTGNRRIDGMIGAVPLSLWLPYTIYRRTHLAHHATPHATDPRHDPESHYAIRAEGPWPQLLRLERTLLGRLTLGPLLRIGGFLGGELRRAVAAPADWARDWLPHLLMVGALLAWLDRIGLPLATYLAVFVYPGTALTLLRSFAEHRADPDRARRAAIVVDRGPLALLFLNNNLHAVHHADPALPWYRLPAAYDRDRFADAQHHAGYRAVIRRYAFRPHDALVHPELAGRTAP